MLLSGLLLCLLHVDALCVQPLQSILLCCVVFHTAFLLLRWLFLFSVLCFSWSCHSRAHVHGICAICPLTSSRFIHIMRDFERDGRRGDFLGLSKEKARISPAESNESWQKEMRKQDVAEGDDNIPCLFGLQQQQQFVILSVAGACQHLPKHSLAHLRPHTGCSASA